jgi:hypothetical protein
VWFSYKKYFVASTISIARFARKGGEEVVHFRDFLGILLEK